MAVDKELPRHRRTTRLEGFLFGVPYYPEHWTVGERADDPIRMAAASVNVVRMAEFAWDRLEPEEGRLDFAFFDEQIERLGQVGIDTILCTPTATPPRWMTVKCPEILRIDVNGRIMPHGTRQHCCTNSPVLRDYSRKVTTAMAEHYAESPNVIGWQTDNELNCHFSLCYCPACQAAFIEWCREKYAGDIAVLNDAWGNAFWALTYGRFEEIVLPYDRPARANPGHVLDHRRFVSDTTCAFNREQAEILRAANAGWFVTHNGLMQHIDYTRFTRDLDFIGVDLYPAFTNDDHAIPFSADLARTAAGNFLVPELQSGPGGQVGSIQFTPRPGQMRLWAWQAIAHGADGILHFRWRTCRFGAEEYWCGVLDHDNRPRRRYEEFSREGNELRHIGAEILGTGVDVEAGILVSYEQEQAHEAMPLSLPGPREQAAIAHRQMWSRKLAVGLVEATDSFDGLKLLIVPSFRMADEEMTARLDAFVRAGGTVVATAMTGTRDVCNRVTPLTPPGPLSELFGATVEEYGRVADGGNTIVVADGSGTPAGGWYEALQPHGAMVAGSWGADHYAGSPAVTVNPVGKGWAIYIGTFLSAANVAVLLDIMQSSAAVTPLLTEAPDPVEVVRRSGGGSTLLFLLNHSDQSQTVRRVPSGKNLITGETITDTVYLPGREVAVIRLT